MSWLMIIGFIVALVFARITPLHYVFLTGHHILFMATMITIVMASAGMSTWLVIGLGAVLLGILMVSLPAIAHPWMKKLTGDSTIAIGHFAASNHVDYSTLICETQHPFKLLKNTNYLKKQWIFPK